MTCDKSTNSRPFRSENRHGPHKATKSEVSHILMLNVLLNPEPNVLTEIQFVTNNRFDGS